MRGVCQEVRTNGAVELVLTTVHTDKGGQMSPKQPKQPKRRYDMTCRAGRNGADDAIPDKYYRLWGEPMQAAYPTKKGDPVIGSNEC